jgi:hypothetical protein
MHAISEYMTMNDMASGFDPNILLGATLTEANTRRPPIPGGTVLRGQFGKPTSRQTVGKQEKNQGQVYTWIDIPVTFELSQKPELVQIVGQEQVVLSHSFAVDLLPGGKGWDMSPGKNTGLRLLRDALDMNTPGQQFQLFAIEGRQALFTTKIDVVNGEPFDRIASIAHI